MIEPYDPFRYPDDDPPSEQALITAEATGRRHGFLTALSFLAAPKNAQGLRLTYEAVRHVFLPKTESVTHLANRMQVSRNSMHAHIRRVRRTLADFL